MHYSYLYPLKSPTGFAYTLSTGEKKKPRTVTADLYSVKHNLI